MRTRTTLVRTLFLAGMICAGSAPVVADELPSASPSEVGLSAERLGRIVERLHSDVDEGMIPGAVILIARRGKVALYEAVGWQDEKRKIPMKRESIFRIYSMSKPITTIAAMLLVEEGHLKLDDLLTAYLPQFSALKVGVADEDEGEGDPPLALNARQARNPRGPVPARPITIHDLLRHTSGFTFWYIGDSPVKRVIRDAQIRMDSDFDNAGFVDRLARLPLAYQPGTVWESGYSIDVIARIIELISGQTISQFEKERLFDPLGMSDTGFVVTDPAKQALIAEPLPNDEPIPQGLTDPRRPARWESGGAGLVSTARDYSRLLQMMLNKGVFDGKRYLGRATAEYMTTDHLGAAIRPGPFYAPGPGYGFGLGFAVRRSEGLARWPGSIGDYGWAGAAGTMFWVDPVEQLVVVFMVQSHSQEKNYPALLRDMVYAAIDD